MQPTHFWNCGVTSKRVDFSGLLGALSSGGVRFVVTGGLAAGIQGAPVNTFDVDIVHERSTENVTCLMKVLHELDARIRDLTGRDLLPDPVALSGPGHHLLYTRLGALDVLGHIGHDTDYPRLLNESTVLVSHGISCRVQTLESLIRVKEEVGRPRDLAMLPVLRQVLKQSRE